MKEKCRGEGLGIYHLDIKTYYEALITARLYYLLLILWTSLGSRREIPEVDSNAYRTVLQKMTKSIILKGNWTNIQSQ